MRWWLGALDVSRAHLRLLHSVAALALTACTSDGHLGQAPGRLFGIASDDGTGEATNLAALEARVGRVFALDRIYRTWDNASAGSRERETLDAGRIPVVSFNGRGDSTLVSWNEIAQGNGDEHLRDVARSYAALDTPLFMIFHQVSDRDVGEFGTADEFRAAYRRVVEVFRAEGASRVRFVFTMRSTAYAEDPSALYPGDDVVDWIGANAYNYGTEAEGSRWISPRALIADFVNFGAGRKPLMLAEFASTEDPNDPLRKAAWLAEVPRTLDEFGEIRAVIYYHDPDGDLSIESSPPAFDEFCRLALDPENQVAR